MDRNLEKTYILLQKKMLNDFFHSSVKTLKFLFYAGETLNIFLLLK